MSKTKQSTSEELFKLTPNPNNPRKITDEKRKMLKASMDAFGDLGGVVFNIRSQQLAGGHQRVVNIEEHDAAIITITQRYEIPTKTGTVAEGYIEHEGERYSYRAVDWDENTEKAANIAANKGAGTWHDELLGNWMKDLDASNFNLDLTLFDVDERKALLQDVDKLTQDGSGEGNKLKLSDRFLVPPFTVLDARQGYWQDRKRQWLAIGIKSETGRGGGDLGLNTGGPNDVQRGWKESKNSLGNLTERIKHGMTGGEVVDAIAEVGTGTSIFDPVLCELAYRWFSPKEGNILDPFAGGSVRGIVASHIGRQYVGVDLRGEQVKANQEQGLSICSDPMPAWITGDSLNIIEHVKDYQADLIFSCPPYGDLEVYSENPQDISTMVYKDFLISYYAIIKNSLALLKNDRFACFVVGDFRDKKGIYRNFVSHTIDAFIQGGANLYNEAILVTCLGSLPIRAGKAFSATRKMGKTHQNVLIFVKGDPSKATEACGEVEITEIGEDDLGGVTTGE